jgi:hypothetical protein
MTAPANVRKAEFARRALIDFEVLGQGCSGYRRGGGILSPRLTFEGLSQVIRQGYGGAPHTHILASPHMMI